MALMARFDDASKANISLGDGPGDGMLRGCGGDSNMIQTTLPNKKPKPAKPADEKAAEKPVSAKEVSTSAAEDKGEPENNNEA